MANSKKPTMRTPAAPCLWAWIDRPNTKYSKEGKFTVALEFDENDAFIKELMKLTDDGAQELKKGMKPGEAKRVVVEYPFKPIFDEDGEPTGKVRVVFDTNATYKDPKTGQIKSGKPRVFDSRNKLVTKSLMVGRGTTMNVLFAYEPVLVESGLKIFLGRYLNAVRIVKYVPFQADGSSMFGDAVEDEDAFDADAFDSDEVVAGEEETAEGEEF